MSLLPSEKELLELLAKAWNDWCRLDHRAEADDAEFMAAIHQAQQLIALRVARRADPDVWRQPP